MTAGRRPRLVELSGGVITGNDADLVAGRYRIDPTWRDGRVRNPARDTVSGAPVTVLRRPAPPVPLLRPRELERLRRAAGTRSRHLAGVRAVELCGDELHVVCEPVGGDLLDPGAPPAGLTVPAVRRIATELLDALAALHLAGVVHGAVRPDAVLLSPDGALTLLPLPLEWHADPAAVSADDDRRAAATLLLRLLRQVAGGGHDAAARELAEALVGVGGVPEEPWGPAGSALYPPAVPVHPPSPVPLARGPQSLAPVRPGAAAAGAAATPRGPGRARRRPRRRLLTAALLLVAAFAVAALALALLLTRGQAAHRTPTAPRAAVSSVRTVTTPQAPPSSSPSPPSWDLPASVPALVDALQDHPGAAGPSGERLLAVLRGLTAPDGGVVQRSALQLVELVLDDRGLEPRWATAALSALASAPLAGPEGAPASCLGTAPGTPDPVVQQDARQVLDRLPSWQALGLPPDRADRLRELAGPLATGQVVPVLGPCPAG